MANASMDLFFRLSFRSPNEELDARIPGYGMAERGLAVNGPLHVNDCFEGGSAVDHKGFVAVCHVPGHRRRLRALSSSTG
ncbi:hypothetical protein PCAR4_350164 [Paraburkholderia caribensis]|nr:hypothetical protein PCAR4_350164 [Paraburkholderia caribensis]